MPYRTYTNPDEQYAGTAFDPYTGRLNGAQLVMQWMARREAEKQKKKQETWDVEDRELKKRLTEAQISNYYETKPTPVPKPVSKVSPIQVKSLMKRLNYPEEAIAEVDTMNEPALKETWGKLQDHFKQITSSGGRVPATAATAKGRLQLTRLKYALDTVKERKARFTGALTQLYANPEKSMLVQEQISEYEKRLEEIEKQQGEIASMMNNIDESGELTEDQFIKLNTILKFGRSYTPYRPKTPPKTDAEKKLPPGFTIKK
jgi:hypothetical protein